MKKFKIKIPNSDKIGIYIIKKSLKSLSNEKLFGVNAMVQETNELTQEEHDDLINSIKKEYEKRHIEYK